MQTFTDRLRAAASRLDGAWVGALPPFGAEGTALGDLIGQVRDDSLLALVDVAGELAREVGALQALLAGEVGVRSPQGSRDGLAFRAGFASPATLVAAATGGAVGRAAMMVAVGKSTISGRTLTGEYVPPAHPRVAAALAAGAISVEAAHLIVGMLDRVAPRADAGACERAEAELAAYAAEFSLEQLARLVKRTEAHLDPDGVEPSEQVLREGRSLTLHEDRSGRLVLRGVFDPETAAPIRTVLEAYVTAALRASRGRNRVSDDAPTSRHEETPARGEGEGGVAAMGAVLTLPGPGVSGVGATAGAFGQTAGGGAVVRDTSNGSVAAREIEGAVVGEPVMVETRTVAQIRADGLADLARHVLGCKERPAGVPTTTVVVRADLKDLEGRLDGTGFAHLDGIGQPISPGTLRRLACTAELIPMVMGASSLPLDVGRARRYFTRTQVLALWERDGGCASCGQTTFVEAHHIKWFERDTGRTDLSNGVLLCSRCHHRVHADHWEIHIDPADLRVAFIPPTHIDPDRTPRPGVHRHHPREHHRHNHEKEPRPAA